MEYISEIIKDTVYFGPYPRKFITELEEHGFTHFIDLTMEDEITETYTTTQTRIHYPIIDNSYPRDTVSFTTLILRLVYTIFSLDRNKMYIHCKGGRGRSALVAASLLCYMYNYSATQAIRIVSEGYRRRVNRTRSMVYCPNNKCQRTFLSIIFKPLVFDKPSIDGRFAGFSPLSKVPVILEHLGLFSSSEAVYQALKNPTDANYVASIQKTPSPWIARMIGANVSLPENWPHRRVMEDVTRIKFLQHPKLVDKLMQTGLRPIVYHTKSDTYWGDGNGNGMNIMGMILVHLREQLYIENQFKTTGQI